MIKITLESRRDAAALHTFLTERLPKEIAVSVTDEAFTVELPSGLSGTFKEALTDALTDFIIEKHESRWMDDILCKTFYYQDEAERASILGIARAIFDGLKPELPKVDSLLPRRDFVRAVIDDLLSGPSSFSLQSLTTFRLNDYFECLTNCLEIAIDEYKLQQEYAAFIDKLRRIVKSYRPLRETIYAIDCEPFRLYDEHLRPIDNLQTIRSFYPLLRQWGIDAEPSLLLTLIGLAPLKVYVFTERPDDEMMRTLQNVFEERVQFFALEQAKKIDL